jgi:putative protease
MSPRDLKTIHFLDRLLDAGVTILKIEGRARPPEYVKTVSSCYDEAIRACVEGTFSMEMVRAWDERLSTVFNRGFWDGYYLGQRLGEWSDVHGSKATRRRVYVGKGTNYFDRIGVAEVIIETGNLQIGDSILVTGPTTGVVETSITELRVNEKEVRKANKGDRCSFPVASVIRRSDKIYKMVSR